MAFSKFAVVCVFGGRRGACMVSREQLEGISGLSFHHVSPRNPTQVIRLTIKFAYPRNNVANLTVSPKSLQVVPMLTLENQ